MKLHEVFPSQWLKAADLDGQARLVTIEGCRLEAVEEGKPAKPVLQLHGLTQGLVLNKTNGESIAAFLGDDLDRWPGQKIVLVPAETDFQGKRVPCIRIRPPKPQGTSATAKPAPARASKAAEELPAPESADDVQF